MRQEANEQCIVAWGLPNIKHIDAASGLYCLGIDSTPQSQHLRKQETHQTHQKRDRTPKEQSTRFQGQSHQPNSSTVGLSFTSEDPLWTYSIDGTSNIPSDLTTGKAATAKSLKFSMETVLIAV